MMGDIFIIDMHENHVDEVVRIDTSVNTHPFDGTTFISEIQSPTHILLVAIADSDSVSHQEDVRGFAGGQVIGDELHIHSLVVDENSRRQGIGRDLILSLIEESIERDCTSATLEVRVTNIAAIKLYESLGFVSEGIRPKYYADNGDDAHIMWLRNFGAL